MGGNIFSNETTNFLSKTLKCFGLLQFFPVKILRVSSYSEIYGRKSVWRLPRFLFVCLFSNLC